MTCLNCEALERQVFDLQILLQRSSDQQSAAVREARVSAIEDFAERLKAEATGSRELSKRQCNFSRGK